MILSLSEGPEGRRRHRPFVCFVYSVVPLSHFRREPFLHHFSRFHPAIPFVFTGFSQGMYRQKPPARHSLALLSWCQLVRFVSTRPCAFPVLRFRLSAFREGERCGPSLIRWRSITGVQDAGAGLELGRGRI